MARSGHLAKDRLGGKQRTQADDDSGKCEKNCRRVHCTAETLYLLHHDGESPSLHSERLRFWLHSRPQTRRLRVPRAIGRVSPCPRLLAFLFLSYHLSRQVNTVSVFGQRSIIGRKRYKSSILPVKSDIADGCNLYFFSTCLDVLVYICIHAYTSLQHSPPR